MARIEWIKHRLDNWALWKDRESHGSLGYATQSVLLSEVVDRYREVQLPIDETDAQVTDQGVKSLQAGRPHLYETLLWIYIEGIGIRETARRMGRAESTVKSSLDQADHALSQWFGERTEAQKKRSLST